MSEVEPGADAGRRVEELLRINAELGAEIRDLAEQRIAEPRSLVLPASRRIAKMVAESEALEAELETALAELEVARSGRDRLESHNQELGRQIHELAGEVAWLRGGVLGMVQGWRDRRRGSGS